MYKVSHLVISTGVNGIVKYGVPRHIPMTGWGDYDYIPSTEVDFEGQSQEEFEEKQVASMLASLEKQLGSTVHAPGCICGFCKMGSTAL